MSEQLSLLPAYLTAHLQLTLWALLTGIAFSVPAGVVVSRLRWLDQPVLGTASVIQTIPSLALLALMVPLLAAFGFQSIGFLPAFIGLVLYSVLPILRNTVTGLAGIDPAVVEAARGLGMTPSQQLRRVELPLAMPVILAGVRTATVLTVGVATLSTPVGATSLGNYIFGGLQTRNYTAVLVGCAAAAALALVLDALVRVLGGALVEGRRRKATAALAVVALLYAYTGVAAVTDLRARGPGRIVVGAKTFTEQYILSHILAERIRRATGAPVQVLSSLGSTVVFDALRTGQVDVYVDYSGTIWATILRRDAEGEGRDEVIGEVGAFLRDEYGIELVGPLGFENAYALAMRRSDAEARGIRTIAQLAAHAPELRIGGDYEFFSRPEWRNLERLYGLRFREQRSMDSSLMYQAAATGGVDVISAFSTDGRITALDLVVLEDDRGAIPPYDAIILAGPRLVQKRPDVVAALRPLVGTIDADHMRRMNLSVDEGGLSPSQAGNEFLDSLGIEN